MSDADALASVLVDHALAIAAVPLACPCDYGPDGRYRLEELVGIGRESHVYRATDRRLSGGGFEATVAIKISRRGEGLRRDALSARRVSHPNVLAVLDQGVDENGNAYVVAEYADGGDLSGVKVPMRPREAAELTAKIARAVHAMHSAGVVHCDLKPSNVLLGAGGEPKLADFDLARWDGVDEDDRRGNVAFMSPEQFRGEEHALTPPSDVYALGGLLYYLLTGKLPHGQTPEEVERWHASGQPAPSPGVHRDLDFICRRAMAPRREDRYHSAAEMADDLGHWLASRPLYWTNPGLMRRTLLWGRRRPVMAVLAGVGVLAGIGGVAARITYLEREAQRKFDLHREAMAEAKRMVDKVSERVRAHIRYLAMTMSTIPDSDLQDSVLPMLVWIEYLANLPVLHGYEGVRVDAEKIHLLRTLLASFEASGRGGHLDSTLARYALAYHLIDEGESAEPLALLDRIDEAWKGLLREDDQFWTAAHAMRVLARANGASGDDLTQALEEIDVLERKLASLGTLEHIRRLSIRTRDRLKGTSGAAKK